MAICGGVAGSATGDMWEMWGLRRGPRPILPFFASLVSDLPSDYATGSRSLRTCHVHSPARAPKSLYSESYSSSHYACYLPPHLLQVPWHTDTQDQSRPHLLGDQLARITRSPVLHNQNGSP
jgi:hypothetical protein